MNKITRKDLDHLILEGRQMTNAEFEKASDEFLAGKSADEKKEIGKMLSDKFANTLQQYQEVTEEITMLRQLGGMEKYINMAQISRTYFGKSKSWLYQRMHGHVVRGKRVKFTREEKEKLSDALLDLSNHIKSVALNISDTDQ